MCNVWCYGSLESKNRIHNGSLSIAMCHFHWFLGSVYIGWNTVCACERECVLCVKFRGMMGPQITPTDSRHTHSGTHKTDQWALGQTAIVLLVRTLAGDPVLLICCVPAWIYTVCVCECKTINSSFCPKSSLNSLFSAAFAPYFLSPFFLFTYYIKSAHTLSRSMFLSPRPSLSFFLFCH